MIVFLFDDTGNDVDSFRKIKELHIASSPCPSIMKEGDGLFVYGDTIHQGPSNNGEGKRHFLFFSAIPKGIKKDTKLQITNLQLSPRVLCENICCYDKSLKYTEGVISCLEAIHALANRTSPEEIERMGISMNLNETKLFRYRERVLNHMKTLRKTLDEEKEKLKKREWKQFDPDNMLLF